jgi:hypothetical protein
MKPEPPDPEVIAREEAMFLADALMAMRFSVTSEDDLQVAIADMIDEAQKSGGGLPYIREHRFSARDRIDFFFPTVGIGLEVKWAASGGSPAKVVEQLQRYAEVPELRVIIFASPSGRVLARVPSAIGDKEVYKALLHTGI